MERRRMCHRDGDPATIAQVNMHRRRFRADEFPKLRRVLRELNHGPGVDIPA